MARVKPWKSMADQLALLKNRGLLVENDEAAFNYLSALAITQIVRRFYLFAKY